MIREELREAWVAVDFSAFAAFKQTAAGQWDKEMSSVTPS